MNHDFSPYIAYRPASLSLPRKTPEQLRTLFQQALILRKSSFKDPESILRFLRPYNDYNMTKHLQNIALLLKMIFNWCMQFKWSI